MRAQRTFGYISIFLSALALLTTGCASGPQAVSSDDVVRVSAKVTAVDLANRHVTVEGDNGPLDIFLDDSVKNLGQIKAGDDVIVNYYQSVAAELKKSDDTRMRMRTDEGMSTAEAGAQPGQMRSREIIATVRVDQIDVERNTVTFTGPRGNQQTVAVKKPVFQEYIRQLKVGDLVEIKYQEAVAVSVEPSVTN